MDLYREEMPVTQTVDRTQSKGILISALSEALLAGKRSQGVAVPEEAATSSRAGRRLDVAAGTQSDFALIYKAASLTHAVIKTSH